MEGTTTLLTLELGPRGRSCVTDKWGMISKVLELVEIEGILLHQVGYSGNVHFFKLGLLIGNKD
jgi:hypothetical protein